MPVITSTSLYPEPLRTLAFGFINDVTYTTLGSSFVNPTRLIHLQNLTDVDVTISFDGVDDHLYVASGGFVLFDVTTNRDAQAVGLFFSVGTRLYVRSVSGDPTLGVVALSTLYGRN